MISPMVIVIAPAATSTPAPSHASIAPLFLPATLRHYRRGTRHVRTPVLIRGRRKGILSRASRIACRFTGVGVAAQPGTGVRAKFSLPDGLMGRGKGGA